MTVRLAVALATVLLLVAAGAPAARAGWSAPADIGAGGGPALWMGSDGRVRVVSSDMVRTWIAFGDRTGRFTAPADLTPGLGPAGGYVVAAPSVRAAARPDGSAVVILQEEGCPAFAVHCTPGQGDPGLRAVLVRADGSRGAKETLAGPEDLRGGADAVPVAEPGGRWAAAWSGGTAAGAGFRYAVKLAEASADGRFGPATTLASGEVNERLRAADAAAGADGTLAVAWTRGQPQRVWVAVRARGAEAFGPPERVSSGAPEGDLNPRVAVGEDGTVTVAWSTAGSGALLRDRPPGGAWEPPETLTADPAPALDLVPAPAGGLAAIWTPGALTGEEADAALRVALRPRGGAFRAADVTPTGGRNGGRLAFDAAGTAYAAWAWQSGQAFVSVRPAGDVSWTGPVTLTDERTGTATIAIAAGPPSLAAVAWSSEVAGGQAVAASVFSRTNAGLTVTPAEPEPGTTTPRGPRATLRLLDRRLGARERLLVTCDVPCRTLATAGVIAGSRWAPLASVTDRRLRRVHRLTFRVPARVVRTMRAIRKPLVLRVSVRVRDRAGRTGSRGQAFALRRPR